jgi:hypothetical protein
MEIKINRRTAFFWHIFIAGLFILLTIYNVFGLWLLWYSIALVMVTMGIILLTFEIAKH